MDEANSIENNLYKTKDLEESSALIVKGLILKKVTYSSGTCFFLFADVPQCEELSAAFFLGDLQCNARELFNAYRRLRSTIFKARGDV